jgi:hypothetical protein
MKNKYSFAFIGLLTCVIVANALAQTRIVLTTALTDNFYEVRKKQYLESFRIYSQLGYKNLYMIEGFKRKGPTFLNMYSKNVFYASVQDLTLEPLNNGINEAKTFLQGIINFKFHPEDMIIKITGRYHLLSDYFLKLVEENQGFDVIGKFTNDGYVLTLGIAMKCKHFIEMYKSINYEEMERNHISLEIEVMKFIEKKRKLRGFKVFAADKLDINASLYGNSTFPPYNTPEYENTILTV